MVFFRSMARSNLSVFFLSMTRFDCLVF